MSSLTSPLPWKLQNTSMPSRDLDVELLVLVFHAQWASVQIGIFSRLSYVYDLSSSILCVASGRPAIRAKFTVVKTKRGCRACNG